MHRMSVLVCALALSGAFVAPGRSQEKDKLPEKPLNKDAALLQLGESLGRISAAAESVESVVARLPEKEAKTKALWKEASAEVKEKLDEIRKAAAGGTLKMETAEKDLKRLRSLVGTWELVRDAHLAAEAPARAGATQNLNITYGNKIELEMYEALKPLLRQVLEKQGARGNELLDALLRGGGKEFGRTFEQQMRELREKSLNKKNDKEKKDDKEKKK